MTHRARSPDDARDLRRHARHRRRSAALRPPARALRGRAARQGDVAARPRATCVRFDHRRRHRRAAGDRAVRERPRTRVHLDRPPGVPLVHSVRTHEGGPGVRRRRLRVGHLCRVLDGGRRRRLRRERGAALARRRNSGSRPARAGCSCRAAPIGNLSALVAAREVARRRHRDAGLDHPPRWIIVCSAEAHSSIVAAAAVMDVDVVTAAPDAAGRLHGDAVAAALDEHGAAVFAVVATGGTTNFGIVDDIASIAAVTRDRDVWLHVDGAYGLAAMLVERMRPPSPGSARPTRSSSIRTSGCSPPSTRARSSTATRPWLCRRTRRRRSTSTPSPSRPIGTRRISRSSSRGARAACRCGSPSRPHGTAHYRAAVDAGIRLAERIGEEITAREGLSLVREPQLSVVVFRREGWTLADYQEWSTALLEEQRPSSSRARTPARRCSASRSSAR